MLKRLQGLFVGVLIGVLLTGGLVFAKTGTEMIEVTYQNVKLYVDGVLITPKDANGNIVEPFVSKGTTYLPVRALSEALGKDVRWDGSTNSVVVGLMPGNVVYLEDVIQPYQTEGDYWQTDTSKGTYIPIAGVKYYHGAGNGTYGWNGPTDYSVSSGYYNLNSQYSQLSGMYGPWVGKTWYGNDCASAENLKISFFGDGRLIKTLEFKNSDMPKDFSVDLSGVLQLKIELTGTGASIVNWQIR